MGDNSGPDGHSISILARNDGPIGDRGVVGENCGTFCYSDIKGCKRGPTGYVSFGDRKSILT